MFVCVAGVYAYVCVCMYMYVYMTLDECACTPTHIPTHTATCMQRTGKFAAHMHVSSAHNGNTIVCTLSFQFQLWAKQKETETVAEGREGVGERGIMRHIDGGIHSILGLRFAITRQTKPAQAQKSQFKWYLLVSAYGFFAKTASGGK